MDRYKQVNIWLSEYPKLYGWLDFNAIRTELSAIAFKTVPTTSVIKEDVCGNKTIEMPLAIEMVQTYDTAQNDTNYDALNEVLAFKDWIETQNELKNYPVFDDNETVERITVTQPIPTIAVDQSQGLAHYQFLFNIVYKQFAKEN